MEHFEYIVKPPKGYGRLRSLKIKLLIGYAAFLAVTVFLTLAFVPLPLWPVMAVVIAGILGAVAAFSWRYTRSEYEYSVDDGVLTLSIIYSGRTRRTILEFPLRDAEIIAPTNGLYDGKIRDFDPEATYWGVYTVEQANYFAIFTDEDDTRTVFYLHADLDAAKKLRRINGRTVVSFEK